MTMIVKPIRAGDGDPRHGTEGGYTNHRCRCEKCRAAWNTYCLRRRDERLLVLTADDPRHGSDSTYTNYKCRCAPCRAAHTAAQARMPYRRVEA